MLHPKIELRTTLLAGSSTIKDILTIEKEKYEIIPMGEEGESKHVKICNNLLEDMRQRLIKFFKSIVKVFTWKPKDMSSINP